MLNYRAGGSSEEMLFSSAPDGAISFARLSAVHFSNHKRSLVGRMFVAAAAVLAASTIANAEEPSPQTLEYRVKAGFLYNFAKYVEWPTGKFGSSTDAIVIGILGADPFGKTLDTAVAGKTIDGHSIRIRRFQRIEEFEGCHILFIGASEKNRLTDIHARLRGHHVLTVGDADGFLQQGGQIHFVTEDHRVKFDINWVATREAGLKLDANLLRAARRVIGKGSNSESR